MSPTRDRSRLLHSPTHTLTDIHTNISQQCRLIAINITTNTRVRHTIPLDRWAQAYINLRKIYINLENHREHPHKHYIARKQSHWVYTVVADSMGLSSLKFSWWAPKDARVLKQSV